MTTAAITLQLTRYKHKLKHYFQPFKPKFYLIRRRKDIKTSNSYNHHICCIPEGSVCVEVFWTVICVRFQKESRLVHEFIGNQPSF